MVLIEFLLFFLFQAKSLIIERIPSTNSPPVARSLCVMETFPDLNTTIVFGGYSDPRNAFNDLWSFDMERKIWNRLAASNDIYPSNVNLAARYSGASFTSWSELYFYIFGGMAVSGPLNDLWRFQADGFLWTQIITYGEIPSPRLNFGYSAFEEEDILKFAVFGGLTMKGDDNGLYLLDTSNWTWKKLPQNGDFPPAIEGATMDYYNGCLFIAGGESRESANQSIQTFYLYNLTSEKWINITSEYTYTPRILYGSALIDDELYLMNGYSNVTKTNVIEWYKVSLSDPKYEWTQVQFYADSNSLLAFDSYGYAYFKSSIFIFAGDRNPPIINQFFIFDLEKSPIKYDSYDSYFSPSPRMYHSMQAMSDNLYLFGGLGINEELYNDLWTFNCVDEVWKTIDTTGDIPPKRYGYASASNADLMLVWGGYGVNGYLNDGYIFDSTSNAWHTMTYSDDVPSPRVGACGAQMGSKIVIYGGLTESGLSDELWVYDLITYQYTLLDKDNNGGPGKMYYATCRMSTSIPDFVYVLYGETEDEKPLNSIFTFNMSSKVWYTNYTDTVDLSWARAKSSVYKLKTRILVIGGETYGNEPKNDIFYLDLNNNEHVKIGQLENSLYAAAFAYFQNYVYIHGGGTAVGSILRFNVPSNKFIRIHLWSDCTDNTTCFWACSPGTFRSDDCIICPPGSYSDGFNHTYCDKCPPGKYYSYYGASSEDLCYPCQEGTYNKHLGAAECLECPFGSTCDVGSVEYSYDLKTYEDKSTQPALYSPDTNKIHDETLIIESTVGFVGLVVILVLFLVKKGERLLENIDLYTTNHNHIIGEIMYLKQTWLGGAFSIIFIFLAIIAVGTALVSYSLNNVYESKSLVPLVVLDQDISNFIGDFTIIVTLIHYGGTCVVDNDCSSDIAYAISGINGNFSQYKCKAYDNGDCDITLRCKSCEILSSAEISYAMNNQNGYASGFTVNVTSSSSIPNEKSSYETSIQSSSNYVFMGATPSVVYFYSIPSYYSETQTDKNHTGYHMSLKQASEKGSEYQSFELALAFNSYLNIKFDIGTNGLVTTRNARQTWIILITTLLGSVFGIMGSIGGILKLFEKRWTKLKNKLSNKAAFQKIKENSDFISSSYENPYHLEKDSPLSSNPEKSASSKFLII